MSRDLTDLPGAGDQRDPVAEFFDRERDGVRELPAGPDRWEAIVREARRPVRRSWLPYAGGAAAAVVVAAAVWAGQPHRPDDASPATASSQHTIPTVKSTVTTTVAPPTPSTTPSAVGTTPSGPLPAPASFSTVSMSNGGHGTVVALGSASCAMPCASVIGSDDDGATWTARATLQGTAVARRTPDGPGQLVGLRMADSRVGYAYGTDVWRTADGGRHWSRYDVAGRTVLSLETDGRLVWLVTADRCRHTDDPRTRGCTGLEVWSAPVAQSRGAVKLAPLAAPRPVEAAWLSMDKSDAYVSTAYADATQSAPVRVSGAGAPAPLARPKGCDRTGGLWVSGTAKTRGGLVLVCRTEGVATKTYSVATSTDRGTTWTKAVQAADLGTPGPAGVWLTAVDTTHLVAVTSALPTSAADDPGDPRALLSSSDSGASWTPSRVVKGTDSWSWAGAAGGSLVYALGGTANGFDVSTDRGVTFGQRMFRQ